MTYGRVGRLLAVVGLMALLATVAACGGGDDASDGDLPGGPMMETLGEGEGEVNLIAWAGYVEDGSTDPAVDWVSDFEADTGCQVNVKIGNTSDEMVTLMQTGEYDGVSASGDATLRLIRSGDVSPVNTDLIPNYADVFEGLKEQPFNSVDGQMYGVPHGRGANLLMWNTDEVDGDLDSWGAVWDENSPYAGNVTAYDSPIYIADAALYLKATEPDLDIDNVYELDEDQFNAAVDLLKKQNGIIGEYWSDYTKQISAFAGGDSVARDHVAGHREPARGRRRADRDDAAEGRLDRLVGHVDGLVEGRSIRTACTCGWTTSSRRRRTPPWPSGSARRPRTRRRARRRQTRITATRSTQTTRSTSTRSPTGRRPRPTAATTVGRSARRMPTG